MANSLAIVLIVASSKLNELLALCGAELSAEQATSVVMQDKAVSAVRIKAALPLAFPHSV